MSRRPGKKINRDRGYIIHRKKQTTQRRDRRYKQKKSRHLTKKRKTVSRQRIPIKIHFIWIGTIIPDEYLNNIIRWRELNLNMTVCLWIDQRTIDDTRENIMNFYRKVVQHNIKLLDVAEVFNKITDQRILQEVTQIYETEIGLIPRVLLGDENIVLEDLHIKNYGMATDILRILIVKYFKGFYLDTDLIPTDLNPFVPRNKRSFLYAAFKDRYSNSFLYFNSSNYEKIDTILRYIIDTVIRDLYENKSNYINYLTDMDIFTESTVTMTGPQAYDLLQENVGLNLLQKLRWINELDELKMHTWVDKESVFSSNEEKLMEKNAVEMEWSDLEKSFNNYLIEEGLDEDEWKTLELKEKLDWLEWYDKERLEDDGETKGE